ncbi:MAG: rnhB [Bacillus sp. (in: firmicutes)]|nr:rnhB [Bacillus sp. (in: firmicutes)]
MSKLSIREIAERLKSYQKDDEQFIRIISNDERKGVQQLVLKWKRQCEQENLAREKFAEMSKYEISFRKQGYQLIAGIDEVGRGPLAGPVVAAAVILPEDFLLLGIDDSKKLTETKREEYYDQIMAKAISVSIGSISPEEIDNINIYEATKKAMLAAVSGLDTVPDFLLIDAMKLTSPYPYEAIIKGDAKSISIAAASIIAKVTRDRLMKEIGLVYPEYGFANNMGYGTKEHLIAIEKNGITPHHRKSFAPVKDYV